MNAAVQKIVLSSSRDIPFNKLVLSQSNIRRVKSGLSVEELAEDIGRRGLLQSLNVRPVRDDAGQETGQFEVPAGGRRFRALELLVKQKRLEKTAPVPCVVRELNTDILAEDDSLAENTQRLALHPLDQFRAFLDMRTKGMTEEAIAAAFFTTVQVVKQRLRLASVSPALLVAYEEDEMTLEQLMAFTVSGDHARQEQVWETIRTGWQKDPYHIRRMLTEISVPAYDRRARFVGIEAYEAAGGEVLRDLFQGDNGGWLQDVGLLDRLTNDKLKAAADEIGAEGWKWIEAAVDFPYGIENGLRRLSADGPHYTEAEQAEMETLQAEYDAFHEEYESCDEFPGEVDQRLGEIEAALEAFDNRPAIYAPSDIAIGGVFLSLDSEGGLSIRRGYVRPEDEALANAQEADMSSTEAHHTSLSVDQAPAITIDGQSASAEDEDETTLKPLPERLVIELTAHRTLALRDNVAHHPHVALTLLLHKLVSDCFRHRPDTGCLEASIRSASFPFQSDDLKESLSARNIAERHEAWQSDIPTGDEELWDWLNGLDDTTRLMLLAHCVSFGVNALHEKVNPYGAGISARGLQGRFAHADRLAQATGLDMVDAGWRPTVANYLGRVTKPRILEAVREGVGERPAQLIEHLKKGDMAVEAQRLLADSGWLPDLLRLPAGQYDNSASSDTNDIAEDEPLPAFLSDDSGDEEECAGEDDEDVQHFVTQ
ncbi:ParB/RepB/Spo0J family partition protein [Asticcacaulis tiandongensis]|uniref:ParB/RepB/Spo0J family partition protein n=1 Tax=Asticcacaulis tiandongensis TaxID=2565365 RepID=UPI0011267BBA|nr:ParB/RepB/Spo0J family partition protein [Asticcacaulis tiandongensis]